MGLHGVDTLGFCPFSAGDATWSAAPSLLPLGQANKPGVGAPSALGSSDSWLPEAGHS